MEAASPSKEPLSHMGDKQSKPNYEEEQPSASDIGSVQSLTSQSGPTKSY